MIANNTKTRPTRVSAPNGDAHRTMRNLGPLERRRADYPRAAVKEWPAPSWDNALIRKVSNFIRLSPDEKECLVDLQSKSEKVTAGTDLAFEGQTERRVYILQSGWAYCYKLLPDGGRQVITFSVPGDFLGLRSILLRASDHSFATVTDSVVSPISVASIFRVFKECPRMGQAILWTISRDQAISVEHLVGVGRRSAVERTAHFFLEMKDRLSLAGISSETGFECPLNQYLLSDALGLTAIHLNRVLRQLRERGLMTVKENRVLIHDMKGLTQLAGYDNAYLDQPPPLVEAES